MRTIYLEAGKCALRGCIFCGYSWDEPKKVDLDKLKNNFDKQIGDEKQGLKIFVSGSFLDDAQFPKEFRKYVIEKCKERGIKKLIIESNPHFITKERLDEFEGLDLTVAIGLEIANNEILKKINKKLSLQLFEKAVETLKKNNVKLRTYLLVNLPFVENVNEELKKSVEYAKKYSDSIVLINLLPHAKTRLLDMWLNEEWRPLSKKEFYEITKQWENDSTIELDAETFRFIPKFPKEKRIFLKGANSKVLNHPNFRIWQEYFQKFYEIPKEKDILLFVPCSYKKPYPKSRTHMALYGTLRSIKGTARIHMVVVSTPGVVPIEHAGVYPFASYDWPEWLESPELMKEYIEVTKQRVKDYLKAHKYKKYYCFMKYTQTYEAIKKACDELSIKIENLLNKETYEKIKDEKNPIIHKAALDCLRKNLKV